VQPSFCDLRSHRHGSTGDKKLAANVLTRGGESSTWTRAGCAESTEHYERAVYRSLGSEKKAAEMAAFTFPKKRRRSAALSCTMGCLVVREVRAHPREHIDEARKETAHQHGRGYSERARCALHERE
jgi:hypothetical protein